MPRSIRFSSTPNAIVGAGFCPYPVTGSQQSISHVGITRQLGAGTMQNDIFACRFSRGVVNVAVTTTEVFGAGGSLVGIPWHRAVSTSSNLALAAIMKSHHEGFSTRIPDIGNGECDGDSV